MTDSEGTTETPPTEGAIYRPQEDVKAGAMVLGNVPNHIGQITATAVPMLVQPTQIRKPWRATVRTIFQALVALVVLFPILVETAGLDPASAPWLVVPLAIAAAVARIMALPQVEVFLRRFLPFLSATGKQ